TVTARLEKIATEHQAVREVRGRGLIQGLVFEEAGLGNRVSAEAFERGLIVETAGADASVLKLLPPLTTSAEEFDEGLNIIEESVAAALQSGKRAVA
ncbi:MAG: aminotransferase class III-fold pyridoxal phosphate-dependent enzyme, partial [Gammaproteobacteria bacterium]